MVDKLNILLHDEAQLLDWGESRAAGPWIKLRLPDSKLLDIFRGMDVSAGGGKKTGHVLNVTISQGDIIPAEVPTQAPETKYGKEAQALHLSGFFRAPVVWSAAGTDAEFLAWLREQRCAFATKQAEVCECAGGTEAAHVRRVSEGAGTGIKPSYCAIPMCSHHHRVQHSKEGEAHFGGKDVFDRLRIKYVSEWAAAEIKEMLGFDHWSSVPPITLYTWANSNEVARLLPTEYRGRE